MSGAGDKGGRGDVWKRAQQDSSTSTSSSDESGSNDESSSEEFFDAEEPHTGTMIRFSRKILEGIPDRVDLTTLSPSEIDAGTSEIVFVTPPGNSSTMNASGVSVTSIHSRSELEEEAEEERRRKRLEEMRRRLNNDDVEDVPPDEQTSPSDSQTSSVEGLYGAISGKSSHPFKVVDHDSVSLQSGVSSGRTARMGNPSSTSLAAFGFANVTSSQQASSSTSGLGSPVHAPTSSFPSSSDSDQVPLSPTGRGLGVTKDGRRPLAISNSKNGGTPLQPEPDLVASCISKSKGSNKVFASTSEVGKMTPPIAPPRRKRVLDKTRSEEGESSRDVTPLRENPPFQFAASSDAMRPKSCSSSSKWDSSSSAGTPASPNPPSPTVSIRSACRELDKTLEGSGQAPRICVVKAQDEEKTRAKNSGPKVLRRTESLPKDVLAAFDPSGSGSGGYRDHENGNSETSSMKDKRGSLSSEKGNRSGSQSRSNSAPKSASSNLSSIVSAIAAAEEQKELIEAQLLQSLQHVQPHPPQFNIIRTRTDSGKLLSDIEILAQVQVLNLDTGERVPLSVAEDKIPKCINPLSLHIMRLTSEYVGELKNVEIDSDEESLSSKKSSVASQEEAETSGVKKKTAQVRRFLGSTVRKTVDKAKSLAHRRHAKEDVEINTNEDILTSGGQDPLVKMKASHSHKGPYDFDRLQQVQDLSGEHAGPVWCMKFSNCGRLLATAGQDRIIRIWVLKDHLPYFQDMRTKNTSEKVSPTPSQESIVSQHSQQSAEEMLQACENSDPRSPFVPRPLCTYSGHTADLLDIAWSKSFFLLSSSMDRTVRLWHISRRECLCCFQHIDFVTAIAFHPRDDRYFLSGSLDGKLRLWNIPDKKVALWNEVNGPNPLITAANFCQNGKFAVVGTYDGRCIFYHTEQLKYHTQIIVHRRKRLAGRKITGIEPMPGEDKIIVTSNDSRIRLYDLRDLSLTCKYKGFTNSSSQIKGTVSHDGKYIVSGSENQCIFIWKTNHDYSKFSSARRDRNGYWEGVKAHNAVVTSAIFAPDPDIIVKQIEKKEEQEAEKGRQQGPVEANVGMVKSPSLTKTFTQQHLHQHSATSPAGYVLVSADFSGSIKVFFSKMKPKHSSLPASALA